MNLNERFQGIGRGTVLTSKAVWEDIKATYGDTVPVSINGLSPIHLKCDKGRILAYRTLLNDVEYSSITGDKRSNKPARVWLVLAFGIVFLNCSNNRDIAIPNERVTLLPKS